MNDQISTSCVIRWLIHRDLPRVLEIERGSFGYLWTEEDFLDALRQRNVIGMVAERDHAIFGFMLYSLEKTHLRVLNFAVAPECRRQGIGRQMVEKLRTKVAAPHRRNKLVWRVRETNLDCLLFLQRLGFLAVGIERQPYEETDEDAIVMEWHR